MTHTIYPSGGDDTAAIQAAFAIDPITEMIGDFITSGPLNPPLGQAIYGYEASITTPAGSPVNCFVCNDDLVSIQGLTIIQGYSTDCGILFRETSGIVVGCKISGGKYGIQQSISYDPSTFDPLTSKLLIVSQCEVSNVATHGILCDRGTNVTISNCMCSDIGSIGILFRGAHNTTVSNCTVSGCDTGIAALQCTTFTISNCSVYEAQTWGIAAGGGHFLWTNPANHPPCNTNYVISDNRFVRCGLSAAVGGGGCTIDPNVEDPLTGTAWIGFEDAISGIVRDNESFEHDGWGFYGTRSKNVTYQGNHAFRNQLSGFYIQGLEYDVIENNLHDNERYDLEITGRSLSEPQYEDEGDHTITSNHYETLLDEAPLASTYTAGDPGADPTMVIAPDGSSTVTIIVGDEISEVET